MTLPEWTARDGRILEAWRTYDDERLMTELAFNSIQQAYRPRDENDVDVDPESLRGKILALYDEQDRVIGELQARIKAAPWYLRWWMRTAFWLAWHWSRFRA